MNILTHVRTREERLERQLTACQALLHTIIQVAAPYRSDLDLIRRMIDEIDETPAENRPRRDDR